MWPQASMAWGISNGTAAGLQIADLRLRPAHALGASSTTRRDPAPEGLSPERRHAIARRRALLQIAPGEGGVITRGEEKIAVWRDDNSESSRPLGELHP